MTCTHLTKSDGDMQKLQQCIKTYFGSALMYIAHAQSCARSAMQLILNAAEACQLRKVLFLSSVHVPKVCSDYLTPLNFCYIIAE